MKKKTKIALLVLSGLSMALAAYIVTYPKSVSWEVVTEENRIKYIEVLNKQNITFSEEEDHLGRRCVTVKGYDIEELEELTKEYKEWKNNLLKDQGIILNGK